MDGEDRVLRWLLSGDPSIRWQTMRDLAGASTGGARRMGPADPGAANSTTYTLLLLRWLGIGGGNRRARTGTLLLLDAGLYRDNGINLWLPRRTYSETCVIGMVLGLAGRFTGDDDRRERLAGHLIEQQMADRGWNCRRPRGATHSSLHTTINVLEGLLEYEEVGGKRGAETRDARERAHEFLYRHRMFRSHRTGAVIDARMTRFSFPPQWHYDVLRGLDYLRAALAERVSGEAALRHGTAGAAEPLEYAAGAAGAAVVGTGGRVRIGACGSRSERSEAL